MNFVKLSRPKTGRKPAISHLIDEYFQNGFQDFFGGNLHTEYAPGVNIIETKDEHRMEIAAPGLKKDDFNINIEKDILSVSVQVEKTETDEAEKYLRREFSFKSFKRSFNLPESVDKTAITGKYEDGVLYVSLPKKEEAKELAPRKVEIA